MAYHSFKDIETPGPKRDFVGYGRTVPRVRWPRDARLSINVVLNYEEGSEYSHPAGDKRSDGLQEVI
ncbi:MAG: allantoinase, partial [Candidatus Rokuibacteriota bacterium]